MMQVPYTQLGLFFNVSDTKFWLHDVKPEWKLHPTIRADVANEAKWWVPDVDITNSLIHVSLALSPLFYQIEYNVEFLVTLSSLTSHRPRFQVCDIS